MSRARITVQGRDWTGTHRDAGNKARMIRDLPMQKLEPRFWIAGEHVCAAVLVFILIIGLVVLP